MPITRKCLWPEQCLDCPALVHRSTAVRCLRQRERGRRPRPEPSSPAPLSRPSGTLRKGAKCICPIRRRASVRPDDFLDVSKPGTRKGPAWVSTRWGPSPLAESARRANHAMSIALVSAALAAAWQSIGYLHKSDDEDRFSGVAGGRRPKLVHRPELVTRSDGRYEVECRDCRARSDEALPIGIGLAVSSEVLALEMLRNHVGPAAWSKASQILPSPHSPPVSRSTSVGRPVGSESRSA
jgi:hypothetical protein